MTMLAQVMRPLIGALAFLLSGTEADIRAHRKGRSRVARRTSEEIGHSDGINSVLLSVHVLTLFSSRECKRSRASDS